MRMPGDPKLRCSDADRERTVALLREHLAAGRLTAEEFHERLDAAYAAKTLGQLDELLADLPAIDLTTCPTPRCAATGPATASCPWGRRGSRQLHAGSGNFPGRSRFAMSGRVA